MINYDDIINMPRPKSKKHKPMSLYNRAAQFSSFAALSGYEDVIAETGRTTERMTDLDEYEKDEINIKLIFLSQNPSVSASFEYFVKDKYKEGGKNIIEQGCIKKVKTDTNEIVLDNKKKIDINSIVSIEY